MNHSNSNSTRTETSFAKSSKKAFPNSKNIGYNFSYVNNHYDNNSNTNLLASHSYQHQRTESSDTVEFSAFSSESEESDNGGSEREKTRTIKKLKEVKVQRAEEKVMNRENKIKSNIIEYGYTDSNGNVTSQDRNRKCGCIPKKLRFWKRRRDTLPINNKYVKKEHHRGDGVGGNNSSTSPNTQDLRTTESIVCMIMLSSQTKEFPCEECTGYPGVFYNVSTFCVLKGIWANAINKTSLEQDLGWMSNSRFCEWGGVSCDSNKNIIALTLKNPYITSTLSNDMGNLITLQNLSISGSGTLPSDKIPTTLFQLPNLISLSIVSTGLTGGIPDTINNMTSLKFLTLSKNQNLGGVIPSSIGLSSLTTLIISGQGITGTIPNFLGESKTLQPNLQNLDLSLNSLTGTIPPSLMLLNSIKSLVIQGNRLEGSIPSIDSSKFPSLVALDLGTNNLTGTIPSSISTLDNLRSLRLTANKLTGSIPSSFKNLDNLKELDLSNNKLSGNIPIEIGSITLDTLILSENTLTGAIPGNICQRTYNRCDLSSNSFSSTGSKCGQCSL